MPEIAVLDYGIGNLRSVVRGLCHVGAHARLVTRPDQVDGALGVVLPGVGDFGRCREALRRTGLDEPALRALKEGRPFLGICVGFQLLYEGSDEAPGVDGLGALPGVVRPIPDGVKRPQIQWNQIEATRRGSQLMAAVQSRSAPPLWVYFIHSYAPGVGDETVAVCDYGGRLAAAAERDCIWGTQFHPEKSGAAGLGLLAGFVALVREQGTRL